MDGSKLQQIFSEFQFYSRSYRDTLGEFIAHYHKLYLDVSVMGVEGILYLILLLPEVWRRWSASLIPKYADHAIISGNLYGDCRGFIAAISHQNMSYGDPPPGQHEIPPGYEALGVLIEYEPPSLHPIPFVFESIKPTPVVDTPDTKLIFEQIPEPEPILKQSFETLSPPCQS